MGMNYQSRFVTVNDTLKMDFSFTILCHHFIGAGVINLKAFKFIYDDLSEMNSTIGAI